MTRIYSSGVQFSDGTVQTRALPLDTVYIWSGSIASIPAGYQLCNGLNGTPNLLNKMVVGAGNLYNLNDTGGSTTVALTAPQIPSHTHPLSFGINAGGSHSHSISIGSDGSHTHPAPGLQPAGGIAVQPGPGGVASGPGASLNAAGAHSHAVSVSPAGSHQHSIGLTVNPVGTGAAHENMPPYYALALIMWRP